VVIVLTYPLWESQSPEEIDRFSNNHRESLERGEASSYDRKVHQITGTAVGRPVG